MKRATPAASTKATSKTKKRALNAAWHEKNVLGGGAQLAKRIAWHVAHQKVCACRPMPASIVKALARRE